MIDLHTHTLFSDGELIPSELARRARAAGLVAIAMTDHGDSSNLDFIVPRIVAFAQAVKGVMDIVVIPGIELTHVPPQLIAPLVARARELGARIVVAHGETIVEPVAPGTNLAAIKAGVDVLAHPGLLSQEEAELAAKKGVLIEITGRKGHSLTNGLVARVAKAAGCKMVVNSDSHAPGDLMGRDLALKVVLGAGLSEEDFGEMQASASRFM
jgi:histidinol phosphatase-like PHP family hydrolase